MILWMMFHFVHLLQWMLPRIMDAFAWGGNPPRHPSRRFKIGSSARLDLGKSMKIQTVSHRLAVARSAIFTWLVS
jgi:hypothetical protein